MIKLNDDQCFILYACCILVKGAKRSIICDLQKNNFLYITNTMYELFNHNQDEIFDISTCSIQEQNEIKQIIQYLSDNEMGFITLEPKKFPAIDYLNNDYPEILKNLIIDFDSSSKHNLNSISKQISELRCSAIELRFFNKISKEQFCSFVSAFDYSTVRTIQIILPSNNWTILENLDELCVKNKRLKRIVVFSHQENTVQQLDLQTLIVFSKQEIKDESHCGNISPHYFNPNIDFFKESLCTNNCLDKKIGIDRFGYIKNCPSMSKNYGHIDQTTIKSVLERKDYSKISNIKKDEIEICQDCEFRYICMDCRAYIQTESNIYSKPQKCNYNPYTTIWT